MQDGPRRAAEQDSLQEPVATGADDHKVSSPGPGFVDDRGGRLALDGDRARDEIVGAKPGCHRCRDIVTAPVALHHDGVVGVGSERSIARRVAEPPGRVDIDRMHHPHVTRREEPAPPDELGGRHRDVRSVRADQDAFGGRRSGDEDGTGSLVDDLRRNRAEQRFLDRPMPAGAEDDQVGPDLPRRVDDDRGGTAFDQSRRDVQPEPAQASCRRSSNAAPSALTRSRVSSEGT